MTSVALGSAPHFNLNVTIPCKINLVEIKKYTMSMGFSFKADQL